MGYETDKKDVLQEGCLDNQTSIRLKLLSFSLNCAVIKTDFTMELQMEQENWRQVSRMLPNIISLSQSHSADKVRRREIREVGVTEDAGAWA